MPEEVAQGFPNWGHSAAVSCADVKLLPDKLAVVLPFVPVAGSAAELVVSDGVGVGVGAGVGVGVVLGVVVGGGEEEVDVDDDVDVDDGLRLGAGLLLASAFLVGVQELVLDGAGVDPLLPIAGWPLPAVLPELPVL